MSPVTTAFLIGLGFGAIFAFYIVPLSSREEAIHGGPLARLFHYLGATCLGASLVAALVTLILGGGLWRAIPLAFGFTALGFVLLLIHAIFERAARDRLPAASDTGWTEEQARSSGL